MITARYRPDPRFVAKVLAWLMVVGACAVGPVPVLAAGPGKAAVVSAPLPAGRVSAPAGAVSSNPTQDAGSPNDARHQALAKVQGEVAARNAGLKPAAGTPLSAEQQAEEQKGQQAQDKARAKGDDKRFTNQPAKPDTKKGPALKDLPQQAAPTPAPFPAASARPVAMDGPSSSGQSVQLVSLSSYGASYTVHGWNSQPTYLNQGSMNVDVVNTSNATWPAGQVAIGSHIYYQNGSTYSWFGATSVINFDVPGGGTHGANIPMAPVQTMPSGTYIVVFDMLDMTTSSYVYFSETTHVGLPVPVSSAWQFTVPHYAPTGGLIGPLDGATVNTMSPLLQAQVLSDTSQPTDGMFQICTDQSAVSCRDSGWQSVPVFPPNGFTSFTNWTPPPGAIQKWNTEYWWRFRVRDPQNQNPPWSGWSGLQVVVPNPTSSSHYGVDPGGLDAAGVNMFGGNYARQENDLGLPVPSGAIPLQVSRTYNSANPAVGAFGAGWTSLLDMSLQFTGSGTDTLATVTFPDGKQTNFGENFNGTWLPAYGEDQSSVFSSIQFDQHLDFANGTHYQFTGGASFQGLAKMVAPDGAALTLSRDGSGHVTQMTDSQSGRSLYLSWNGNHVGSVSTAPVQPTAGAFTWHYTYTGDLLTQVCDAESSPAGGYCTRYGYGETGPITYQGAPSANMCVDVDAEGYAQYYNEPRNGKRIQLWGCNGAPGQQLAAYPDGTIRVLGKCLDITGNSSALGAKVELWDCNGVGGQQWQQLTDGSQALRNPQSGLCLDLPSGIMTGNPAPQLQIWTCNNQNPQRWGVTNGTPRLVSIQRPNSNNVTTIDYQGAYVARVGEGYNPSSHSWANSWTYARTGLDPTSNGGKSLSLLVTDPTNTRLTYEFGTGGQLYDRWVNDTSHYRSWTYDPEGRVASMIDENSNLTQYFWDSITGAISDVNRYRDANTVVNTHYWYLGDTTGDQRFGRNPLEITDANHHKVTMTYNSGRLATRTDPNGHTTTYTYTCDSGGAPPVVNDPGAPAGSTQPCGLLASVRDPDNHLTQYGYDRYGDQSSELTPAGRTTLRFYDSLGRMSRQTVSSSSYPGGATTYLYYDTHGRVTTQYDPSVTNPVTGAQHEQLTTNGYDGDGNLLKQVLSDAYGADPARETDYTYDNHDRRASQSIRDQFGTLQQVSATGYDGLGHVSWTVDANGAQYNSYYTNGLLNSIWLVNYVDPNTGTGSQVRMSNYNYDAGGRMSNYTTAMGQTVDYTYTNDDLQLSETARSYYDPYLGQARNLTLHSYRYDLAGNVTQDTQGSGSGSSTPRITGYGYDAANQRTTVTAGVGLPYPTTTTTAYDPTGLVLSVAGPIQTTTNSYNGGTGELLKTAVSNSTGDLVTQFTRDGLLVLSSTDPRGASPMGSGAAGDPNFTTINAYDAVGRLSTTQEAPVTVEDGNGNTSYGVRPTTTYGYDTFGDVTQVKDPRGNLTTTTYDNRGRRTQLQHPNYWNPAGNYTYSAESWTYDNAGNVKTYADPRNINTSNTASYAYDMRNRLYQVTLPAATTNGSRPLAKMAYDNDSNLLSSTDPTGAQTLQTFDSLDRLATTVDVVRNGTSNPYQYTTSYQYDDFGETIATKNSGFVTTKTYDQFGNVANQSSTGRGTTGYCHDPSGHVTCVSEAVTPTSSRSALLQYDRAGRLTQVQHYDTGGNLADTTNFGYDAAGNLTSTQDPRGNYWTSTYDAANRVTSHTDPNTYDAKGNYTGTPVTSMGYDANGNLTRTTDANGSVTLQTYQPWNLPERLREPYTAAHPNNGDRDTTTSYDGTGSPLSVTKPGSPQVVQSASYDLRGQLTGLSATGGDGNVSKTFGYDDAGRLNYASSSGLSQWLTYDDRGLLTDSTGTNNAHYVYDALGRLTSQTDPAGTVTQSYSGISDVGSITDSLTATTRSYTRDLAGQVITEQDKLGSTTGASRSYTYDAVGRVTTDTTKASDGVTVTASTGYSYDPNGNPTRIVASGSQVYSRTTQTYTYDAANRLTRYQIGDPIAGYTNGHDYSWDNAGNRTKVNTWSGAPSGSSGNTYSATTTSTYDARDRLVGTSNTDGSPLITYNWTARGTLASTNQGITNRFDAFDRMIAQGGSTYSYDALDRLVSASGISRATFQYAGPSPQPSTTGSESIARSGDGTPIANRGNGASYGRGLQSNVHGDVTKAVNTLTGDIRGNKNWDPFGNLNVSDGIDGSSAGFQGSWQDYNGMVNAQARWYDPHTGSFLSKDPGPQQQSGAASINNYGYANANPASNSDPSGRTAIAIPGGGIGDVLGGLGDAVGGWFGEAGAALGGLGDVALGALPVLGEGVLAVAGVAAGVGAVVAVVVAGVLVYRMLTADGTYVDVNTPDPALARPLNPPYVQPPTSVVIPTRVIPTQVPKVVAPPAPWVTAIGALGVTPHTWTGATTKWFDDTYIYTQTEHFSQSQFDQNTYFSNGRVDHNRWFGAIVDTPQITSQLIVDLTHPIVTPTPTVGAALAPALPQIASPDGACGNGGGLASCAIGAAISALPPQAVQANMSAPGTAPCPLCGKVAGSAPPQGALKSGETTCPGVSSNCGNLIPASVTGGGGGGGRHRTPSGGGGGWGKWLQKIKDAGSSLKGAIWNKTFAANFLLNTTISYGVQFGCGILISNPVLATLCGFVLGGLRSVGQAVVTKGAVTMQEVVNLMVSGGAGSGVGSFLTNLSKQYFLG